MIAIPRDLARSFRAVVSKCLAGRPRGPAPVVVCRVQDGTLSLWTRPVEVGLLHAAPSVGRNGTLVVPMSALAAVEGSSPDPAELTAGPGLKGTATWSDGGKVGSVAFDALLPGKQHRPPDPPTDWCHVPATFPAALHECGRTAARDAGRFTLTHVQVAGRAGRVAGTDGRVALVWGGFTLPFADDVLAPAIPVFGIREVAAQKDVRVGRTPDHLVVAAGPWHVFLPVNTAGRFPDVAGVVPKGPATVAGFDGADAALLVERLPRLPGNDHENRPVTLDLDGWVTVRAAGEDGKVESVPLTKSPVAGPAVQVAVDRRTLARALTLGCLTLRVLPGKPVVAEGADRTLVFLALDPDLAVTPSATATAPPAVAVPTPSPERRTPAMKPDPTPHADPPDPTGPPDPLTEAEGLRAALADATSRATRLVAALKARKREHRALTQVWSSLRSLNLGPAGGGP